jgi:RNA polymerase sigma-70 factor, ECF subfamily
MREALGADPPGLLARLRTGDARAFEELVSAYQHRVFGVALRMLGTRAEAEEIAQEVFLRAYRALADFRGEARLGTWLYGIASRLCLNRLASPDRRVTRGDAVLIDVPAGTPDAAAEVERAELDAALRAAIAELPDERRLVLVLRDVEGLSYEQIADTLALDPGTVRSRLHRARMQLKEKLERFA